MSPFIPHAPALRRSTWRTSLSLGLIFALGACAGLPTARIELPGALAEQAPLLWEGPAGAARGDFRFGSLRGSFEREASRLDLFGRLTQDRAALRYTLQPEGLQAECQLRATTGTAGVVQAPLQPARYTCSYSLAGQPLPQQALELQAATTASGGREERRGRFVAGGVTLELQSVHRLQGSPLPLAAPAGYLLRHQGQVVAALDLNDTRPRLWLRAPDAATSAAAQQAALALALLWDPAAR